jgi:hypothetical protein
MMPTANGRMGCPTAKGICFTLMEALIKDLLSRVYPADKADLLALKVGTTKDNYLKNKLKEKESSALNLSAIDMRANGKVTCPTVKAERLGLAQAISRLMRENLLPARSMAREFIEAVISGSMKENFPTTS